MEIKEIKKLLVKHKAKISTSNILCIGDMILDHYIYGNVERISPEAPIPILLFRKEVYELGGVGNVVRNITSLGSKVTLLNLSGFDDYSKKINHLINKNKNIKKLVFKVPGFTTPIKTRYINNSSHLVRVDKENANFKLSVSLKKTILEKIRKKISKFDLVILSDYNKGMLDKELIQKIIKIANNNNKIIIVDPKKNDLSIYSNANIITPNQKEVTDSVNKKFLSEKDLRLVGKKIIKNNKIGHLLVTRSEKGMLLINDNFIKKYSAFTKKVYDVTGAGDTVVAALSVMISIGLDIKTSVLISNFIASIVIGKKGTAVMNYSDLKNI
tara:strand:- start:650 stop:1630 length:981 start_codon:yes stop_codon:yes gene_type:complete